ncbi:MAG: hypothetical protein ACOY3Z_07005 [Thermodesulfobacteriota bacterium]
MLHVTGVALSILGALVSVLFWVPRLVDRQRLRDILGPRYPLVYVVYLANGPFLLLLGILLMLRFG